MPGFTPAGMIQTAAQARAAGKRVRTRARQRVARVKARVTTRKAKARGKPRPGTKAWMAYIRTKRKK
jgi:hypothetical protein